MGLWMGGVCWVGTSMIGHFVFLGQVVSHYMLDWRIVNTDSSSQVSESEEVFQVRYFIRCSWPLILVAGTLGGAKCRFTHERCISH